MKRKTKTLKSLLLRAVVTPVVVVAGLGTGMALADADVSVTGPLPQQSAPTLAETLVETNDCWTGAAPAGVTVPGHVVVSVDNRARVGGPKMVGKALEQIFDGVDHGLEVHAFCR